MLMYAKIVNNETGLCMVGNGSNAALYRTMAMTPMDVQQSDIDGQWYLKDKCPMKTLEQKEREERERINMLSLTAADVERAIYKAKGMDFEDVLLLVEQLNNTPVEEPVNTETEPSLQTEGEGTDTSSQTSQQEEKEGQQIDIKALKIELKANNFYRGNPYIEQVGTLLGFTPRMLDEFFETNDYTKLIIPAEEQDSNAVEEGVQDTPSNINIPEEEEVNADTTDTESDVSVQTPVEDSISET